MAGRAVYSWTQGRRACLESSLDRLKGATRCPEQTTLPVSIFHLWPPVDNCMHRPSHRPQAPRHFLPPGASIQSTVNTVSRRRPSCQLAAAEPWSIIAFPGHHAAGGAERRGAGSQSRAASSSASSPAPGYLLPSRSLRDDAPSLAAITNWHMRRDSLRAVKSLFCTLQAGHLNAKPVNITPKSFPYSYLLVAWWR